MGIAGSRPVHRLGGYIAYAPPVDLGSVLDAVWLYATSPGARVRLRGTVHRVLPDAGLSLCFRCERGADGSVLDGELLLMGPIRTIRFFEPSAAVRLEAVRLKPEWCRELLGVDPAEHADALDPAVLVRRGAWTRVQDRLMRTRRPAAAVGVLLSELSGRLAGVRPATSTWIAHAALEAIRESRSATIGLSGLARRLGASERQLRRVVSAAGGAGPKQLHRLHRLNRLVACADATPAPAWARLAVEAGYYDQSHLVNELRTMTGCTPAELHRERRAQRLVRNLQENTTLAS